ncbi:transcription elongation factor A protein 3 isoform X3 [Coregonus clupeaformis]|uniref:transcription elongation factor A protein 3 isoform X3 n=1 Tax=Coregonus clupeaformis TaxID=59861 RepID=UPI001BDFBD93|nr:transcription elongation factor A protein 3 isoform X3 [Coregonus clupeaformis]
MTREEELIRIAKKLDKMVSRNNTEGALDLLNELKSFNMTLKLLQETRIGMSVNGIRKHCTDDEVVSLAKILIKDWKRLLDAARTQSTERPNEMKNGVDSNKSTGSPVRSPSEKDTSHKRPDVSDSDPESEKEEYSDKRRKEKANVEHKKDERAVDLKRERYTDAFKNKQHAEQSKNGKHTKDGRKERHVEHSKKEQHLEEPKRERHFEESRKERHVPVHDTKNERHVQEPKKERHLEEPKKESHFEEPKNKSHSDKPRRESFADELRNERHTEERRKEIPMYEPPQERPVENHRKGFERRDSSDTLSPSRPHPRPTPPSRHTSVKVKKERKKAPPDPNAPLPPLHPHPSMPTAAEVKKERKEPLQISVAQVVRKEPPDPNAPFAPLPLHLHPPPSVKRPSVEVKKERKESSDYKPVSLKVTSSDHVKKDRKDSDSKVPKRPSVDAKKERKDLSDSKPKPAKRQSLDSSDSKQKPPKRPNLDGKKDRKDSTDSKPSHSVKRHSTDSKSDRRDSMDSKTGSSPSAKKFSSEMKESHGSKSSHPGPLQRKSSTDSIERRGKPEMPKIPTTPTSPMSPSFSTAAVPLSPYLATGETIRDKCIEMLAAALRTDDNFKEFGTNCDSMAAEIEDHIYKEMGATDMKYKNRVRSRISNLKDPKNPGLRRNVLAGGIELRRFAIMSAEEMASDELKQLRNNLTKEAIREHQLSKTSGTISDLFQCGKCGKKNCTYNQMQTRSADEPMTTFVLCNECGNRWKFC